MSSFCEPHPPAGLSQPEAYFEQKPYQMVQAGDRWFAVIGVSMWEGLGDHPVEVWQGDSLIAKATASIGDGGFTWEPNGTPATG